MKTWRSVALASVPALVALFCALPAQAKTGSCTEPVTFGTTISSTGRFAPLAEKWPKLTVEFAKMINERGGIALSACGASLPLQIVIYDDGSDPETAARLYERLVAVDKVDFLVGPDWSALGAPVAPVAGKLRVPTVMANVAERSIFRRGSDYVWTTTVPTVPHWSARYFDMLAQQQPAPKSIHFIVQDAPVTREIAGFWQKAATARGYDVTGTDLFAAGQEDFTPLLLRLRLRRPDVIYIAAFDAPSAPLLRDMRRLNVKAGDVHHAILTGALARAAGKDIEGVTGDIAWYPGVKGPYSDFAAELLRRAGIDLLDHPWTMSRIAAYLIMVQAVERAGAVDREKVRAVLAKGSFDTPFGTVAFDETGYPVRNAAVTMQIQNGRPVVVWPPEIAPGDYRYPAPAWQ